VSTTATLVAFSDALAALDRQLAQEHADGLFEGVGVTGEITGGEPRAISGAVRF
jgi:hypothetical protein